MNDCLENSVAVKVFPDREKAVSFIEILEERINMIKEMNNLLK